MLMAVVHELCLTAVPHAGENAKADYAGQGVWNLKAAAEARKFGEVHIPAGSTANREGAYPPVEEWCAFLSLPWSCCGLSRVCLSLTLLCIYRASPSCVISFNAHLVVCSVSLFVSDRATKGSIQLLLMDAQTASKANLGHIKSETMQGFVG